MDEILTMKNVSLIYHTPKTEITAIENVSFTLSRGEFVSLIGPSGCGKSSILSIVAGLLRPSSGEVFLRGEKVRKPSASVGYMFQRDELFPWRTIERNAMLPLEISGKKESGNKTRVNDLLLKYGLDDFRRRYPSELSGGMRQRAALIRTLAPDPELLLLDEPFSALDYQTRLSVADDVYRIIKSEGKTAILVTHDISEAISVSDRILVLSSRPSVVLHEHVLDTDKSVSPLKRRENPDFSKWFERIWGELNHA